MVWSYSRLTAYEHCPFSWYRRYIEGETGEGSFYADNGKAMHEVFDALIKGEVSFEDAPSLYLEKYEAITTYVKQDIMDKTFDTCINYLCNIDENIVDEIRSKYLDQKKERPKNKKDPNDKPRYRLFRVIGIISESFEPYMNSYVTNEEKKINQLPHACF